MGRVFGLVATSIAAVLLAAAQAGASYGPGFAPLVWERQTASNGNGVNVVQDAAILDATTTLTSCDSANGDQLCRDAPPGALIASDAERRRAPRF